MSEREAAGPRNESTEDPAALRAESDAAALRAESDAAALRARVAQLEAENARLAPRPRGPRWRSVAAVVLIVLGALIAPVAVTTAWAKAVMLDTDRFVATFAPLAADPAIQEVVSRQTSEAVLERLDPEQLTADVFDGLSQLDLPPRSRVALQRLEGATAAALSSLVTRVVDDIVRSEEFPKLFEQTLRVSHEQLIAALEGDPEALLRFGADQTISLQLGPVAERVKQALVDRGLQWAASLPPVNRTVVLAEVGSLRQLQLSYGLIQAGGVWLPVLSLVLLAGGVLVANRRLLALQRAGAALAASMVVLGLGLLIGRIAFVAIVAPAYLPRDAGVAVYRQVLGPLSGLTLGVLVAALLVTAVAWLAGSSATSTRLRRAVTDAVDRRRAQPVTAGAAGAAAGANPSGHPD